jgi:hypothetical protein
LKWRSIPARRWNFRLKPDRHKYRNGPVGQIHVPKACSRARHCHERGDRLSRSSLLNELEPSGSSASLGQATHAPSFHHLKRATQPSAQPPERTSAYADRYPKGDGSLSIHNGSTAPVQLPKRTSVFANRHSIADGPLSTPKSLYTSPCRIVCTNLLCRGQSETREIDDQENVRKPYIDP